MTDLDARSVAAEHLALEGWLLDTQDWDAWLGLYAEDAVYWVPAWKSEDTLVSNVKREVSLIYHESCTGLAERIVRIRTRKSVTAMPLPRTVHMVANVRAKQTAADIVTGTAAWSVDEYDPRVGKAHHHFGLYEYDLRRDGNGWKYQRKKTILTNDLIPTLIDFYNL